VVRKREKRGIGVDECLGQDGKRVEENDRKNGGEK